MMKKQVKITFEDHSEKLFQTMTSAALEYETHPSNFSLMIARGTVLQRLKWKYKIIKVEYVNN